MVSNKLALDGISIQFFLLFCQNIWSKIIKLIYLECLNYGDYYSMYFV